MDQLGHVDSLRMDPRWVIVRLNMHHLNSNYSAQERFV